MQDPAHEAFAAARVNRKDEASATSSDDSLGLGRVDRYLGDLT